MRTRSLTLVLSSFALSLLLQGSAAAAPEPKEGPKPAGTPAVRSLPVLKAERDGAVKVYDRGSIELKRLDQELKKLQAELLEARATVKAAESQPSGPLRTNAVQSARQAARRVSDKIARLRMQRDASSTQQELNRLRRIEAHSAYASRLLEVAHRILNGANRVTQARRYTDLAMGDLRDMAELRALEPAPVRPPQVPALDEDASLEDMEWRQEAYKRQLEAFTEQLSRLEPKEARRRRHVKHLNDLAERGYALPGLSKTLAREQAALQEVVDLRQQIERYKKYYANALKELRDRIVETIRRTRGG